MKNNGNIQNLCEVKFREEEILEIKLVEDIEYDKVEVETLIAYLNELTAGKKFRVLVVAGRYSNITVNSLKVLSSPNAMTYALCKAYVISSMSQKMMARFYINVFKPKLPIKFFDKIEIAERWLKDFK